MRASESHNRRTLRCESAARDGASTDSHTGFALHPEGHVDVHQQPPQRVMVALPSRCAPSHRLFSLESHPTSPPEGKIMIGHDEI